MKHVNKQELYQGFIEYVRSVNQLERNQTNRRMVSVFFWCFVLPALVSATILLLVKFHVFPRIARGYTDWLILIFPILYSIYFLSSEVLREVPTAFRRGGIATTLGQAVKEGEWRQSVCEGLRRNITASLDEWIWIRTSFSMDLKAMQYRAYYLTALAGAVFFLIMQGIDSITSSQPSVVFEKHPVFGWIETSSGDTTQFVGLALFLTLLYLSGIQTYHKLKRYLNCVELLITESETAEGKRPSAPAFD